MQETDNLIDGNQKGYADRQPEILVLIDIFEICEIVPLHGRKIEAVHRCELHDKRQDQRHQRENDVPDNRDQYKQISKKNLARDFRLPFRYIKAQMLSVF